MPKEHIIQALIFGFETICLLMPIAVIIGIFRHEYCLRFQNVSENEAKRERTAWLSCSIFLALCGSVIAFVYALKF